MGEAAVGVLEAVGSDRSVERPVGVGAAAARSDSERWTGEKAWSCWWLLFWSQSTQTTQLSLTVARGPARGPRSTSGRRERGAAPTYTSWRGASAWARTAAESRWLMAKCSERM